MLLVKSNGHSYPAPIKIIQDMNAPLGIHLLFPQCSYCYPFIFASPGIPHSPLPPAQCCSSQNLLWILESFFFLDFKILRWAPPLKPSRPAPPTLAKLWHHVILSLMESSFGGELHNLTFGSSKLEPSLWPKLKAMDINAGLGAASWEQIESIEGLFDSRNLDECLQGPDTYGLGFVLLWFDSIKNATSCYAPEWVKTTPKRFPRIKSGIMTVTWSIPTVFSHLQSITKQTPENRCACLCTVDEKLEIHWSSV